jgi:hypothetical protein
MYETIYDDGVYVGYMTIRKHAPTLTYIYVLALYSLLFDY